MNDDKINDFQSILETIMDRSTSAWVYLPSGESWSLESKSAVLESEEVPAEFDDEPDAGIPQFAKDQGFMQVMPVATLQDIVANAREQRRFATADDLFAAFKFYYEHDAFIVF